VRSFGVVALTILLAEDFCFKKRPEELAVEQFVSERAFMLLGANEVEGGLAWPDTRITESYHVSVRTVERLRQRVVKEGLEIALHGKRREPKQEKNLRRRGRSPSGGAALLGAAFQSGAVVAAPDS
jgi:hypothetical protein